MCRNILFFNEFLLKAHDLLSSLHACQRGNEIFRNASQCLMDLYCKITGLHSYTRFPPSVAKPGRLI